MPDRHSARHRIRLRGPWWGETCLPQGAATAGQGRFKTTVPFGWHDQIPDEFIGTVRLSRKFNCSAGMAQAQEVWLTISALTVAAEVRLNGETIGQFEARSDIQVAVSSGLTPFNQLQILLSVDGSTEEVLLGDVAVEMVP